eukprot:8918229-Pyramimonas_sp.AAC.1
MSLANNIPPTMSTSLATTGRGTDLGLEAALPACCAESLDSEQPMAASSLKAKDSRLRPVPQ